MESKRSMNGTIMTSDNDQNDTPARRAALGTLLSLLLRILSFACTQWTLGVLDPAALGQASIQLELMLTTILFASREGFRLALTRVEWKERTIINVSWLSVPAVSLVSTLALLRHLAQTNARTDQDDNSSWSISDYRLAGILYCVAAVVEGFTEPAVLLCLKQLDVTTRAAAEGMATLGKTLALVLCIMQPAMVRNWSVTSFGVSQLVYGSILFLVMYSKTRCMLVWPSFKPNKQTKETRGRRLERYFHRHTCWLTVVFTFQGLFKHALTEGDKIVLTQLEDDYHQGVYSMGLHFGGMAARILLQPLEENARLLFSRQVTQPYTATSHKQKDPLEQSFTVLVKLVMYIGLLFATVAVNYTSVLLRVLAGPSWGGNAEATRVLGAFCVYTALLALNGMTEAFVYGVAASGKQVGGLSMAHLCVGLVFYAMAPFLVSRHGTVGLVAANGVAMVLRCMYSLHFATHFFSQRQRLQQEQRSSSLIRLSCHLLKEMTPHAAVLTAFGLSYGVTSLSLGRLQVQEQEIIDVGLNKAWLFAASQHVVVGIACFSAIASAALFFEREFGQSVRSMLRKKQD